MNWYSRAPARPREREVKRSRRASDASTLAEYGPLLPHLALLLPELGEAARVSDQATVSEAVRGAFAHLAREQHVLLVLDDLHWSDDATLDLLGALAEPLSELPILVVAAYHATTRCDGSGTSCAAPRGSTS